MAVSDYPAKAEKMIAHPVEEFAQRAAAISSIAWQTSVHTSTEWYLRRTLFELSSAIAEAVRQGETAWRRMFAVAVQSLTAERQAHLLVEIEKASRSAHPDHLDQILSAAVSEAAAEFGWPPVKDPWGRGGAA